MEENENNNVFEAKTVQSNAFRVLTEAMKEILTDTNISLFLKMKKYCNFNLLIQIK